MSFRKSVAILFVRIDLTKQDFAVHAVGECGKLFAMVANLPPCTISMEAVTDRRT